MKEVRAVQLSSPDESTFVKTCALFTFRTLRTVADYASQLPEVATKAAADIAEAWEESASDPKR